MTSPASATATRYLLALYVDRASEGSAQAIEDARAVCGVHLEGLCHLSIVDLNAGRIEGDPDLGATTLVKHWPLPVRRLVGDLSDVEKVLETLQLPRREPSRAHG